MFNMYKNGLKVAETEEKKYTFDGLKPKTTYKLGVSRVENNKESEIIELEVTTQELEKPIAPTNVRAVEIEANSFVLMWDPAPNGTYKVHLDGYVKFDNVTDNMVRLDGLTPNTDYQASVMTVLNGMESMPQLVNVKTLDIATTEESIDVEQYHTGAGWYDLPTGDKVRGKENAEEIMKSVDEI